MKFQTIAVLSSLILGLTLHAGAAEPASNEELAARLNILADEVNRLKQGETSESRETSVRTGLGPSASRVYRTAKGVSIGGYGEMLYQNYASEKDNGTGVTTADQIDLLRAVVYFGYRFNEKFLLNTEIEFEHASTGKGGEVSAEFAYLDYLARPEFNVRAGLLLLPMGFINEGHEPTTFLAARRPDTENSIIPSTWRENGIGVFGDIGSLSYRAYLVNGLNADGFSGSGLRGGRQAGARAKADQFSLVGRLDYTGLEGLLVGVSAYSGPSSFYPAAGSGAGVSGVETQIYDLHADWRVGALELRGLATMAKLDHVAELNAAELSSTGAAAPLTGSNSIGSLLTGHYVQAGYDVLAGTVNSFTPFVRWEQLDTQAEVPLGYARSGANQVTITTVGFSYKPIDQVVVKVDFQDYEKQDGTGINQYNALLGYVF